MTSGIHPTEADIGRRVIYSQPALKHKLRGKIVGFNGRWVLVAYDNGGEPLATGAEGLSWDDRKGPKP